MQMLSNKLLRWDSIHFWSYFPELILLGLCARRYGIMYQHPLAK